MTGSFLGCIQKLKSKLDVDMNLLRFRIQSLVMSVNKGDLKKNVLTAV